MKRKEWIFVAVFIMVVFCLGLTTGYWVTWKIALPNGAKKIVSECSKYHVMTADVDGPPMVEKRMKYSEVAYISYSNGKLSSGLVDGSIPDCDVIYIRGERMGDLLYEIRMRPDEAEAQIDVLSKSIQYYFKK
jgi:hypothetical protein